MRRFVSYRKKVKIISITCIFISVVIAIVLCLLLWEYKQKNKKLSNELFWLDEEQYAAMLKENEKTQSEDKTEVGKTEQYNFYEKLDRNLQVNVLFLGDEAMAGGGVSDAENNWVMLLANEIENKYGSDLKGGDYSKPNTNPFYGYHMLKSYSRGLKYDLIILCYNGEKDPENFKICYDGLLRSAKRQNSKCEIFCIIEASRDGEDEGAETIRALCDFYGGVCIDMNKYFSDKRVNFMRAVSEDNVPTVDGCLKYYDAISSVIKLGTKDNRQTTLRVKANLETSKLFDTYEYISLDSMNKVNDKVREFTTSGTVAGLVYYDSHFGGTIRVYVNGKRVFSEINKLDTNVARKVRCKLIANNLSDVSKIRIETDSTENMNNIFGVAVCGTKG